VIKFITTMAEEEKPKATPSQENSPKPDSTTTTQASAVPSWKELQEFISKQTDRDRDLIDKWFRLACSLIGAVFAVAAIVIGIVGWKTISDAKITADEAARAAAKAKISEVLQEQNVKKLVADTASDLFKNGAYRQLIQEQTQTQLRSLHLSARLLDANKTTVLATKLERFKGQEVTVETCYFDEPLAFATSLMAVLQEAGLKLHLSKSHDTCQNSLGESVIGTKDKVLFAALDDLIFQGSDVHAKAVQDTPADKSAAVLVISRRVQ
jgi:hypothetical protein